MGIFGTVIDFSFGVVFGICLAQDYHLPEIKRDLEAWIYKAMKLDKTHRKNLDTSTNQEKPRIFPKFWFRHSFLWLFFQFMVCISITMLLYFFQFCLQNLLLFKRCYGFSRLCFPLAIGLPILILKLKVTRITMVYTQPNVCVKVLSLILPNTLI